MAGEVAVPAPTAAVQSSILQHFGAVKPTGYLSAGKQMQQSGMTEYEKMRREKILATQHRMLELSQLKEEVKKESLTLQRLKRKEPEARGSQTEWKERASSPRRRSDRISKTPRQDYNETPGGGATLPSSEPRRRPRGDNKTVHAMMEKYGRRAEIYTEEDAKKLRGHTEEWTLFVDGYSSSGSRIYDSVNGITCHQCRQKTMGLRTDCPQCHHAYGRFCGDCLFQRYGENIVEVNTDPTWECPSCRDICNCSFCRLRKGWQPTGTLYRKARAQGYLSVAHYLILSQLNEGSGKSTLAPIPATPRAATAAARVGAAAAAAAEIAGEAGVSGPETPAPATPAPAIPGPAVQAPSLSSTAAGAGGTGVATPVPAPALSLSALLHAQLASSKPGGALAAETGGTASPAPVAVAAAVAVAVAVVKAEPLINREEATQTDKLETKRESISDGRRLRGQQAGVQVGRGGGGTVVQKKAVVTGKMERVKRVVQEVAREGGRSQRREERERRKSLIALAAGKKDAGSEGEGKGAGEGKHVAEGQVGCAKERRRVKIEGTIEVRRPDEGTSEIKDSSVHGSGSKSGSDSEDDVWEVVEEEEEAQKTIERGRASVVKVGVDQEPLLSTADEEDESEDEGSERGRPQETFEGVRRSRRVSTATGVSAGQVRILAASESSESDDSDVVEVLPRPAGKVRSKQVTAFETVVQQWNGFLK